MVLLDEKLLQHFQEEKFLSLKARCQKLHHLERGSPPVLFRITCTPFATATLDPAHLSLHSLSLSLSNTRHEKQSCVLRSTRVLRNKSYCLGSLTCEAVQRRIEKKTPQFTRVQYATTPNRPCKRAAAAERNCKRRKILPVINDGIQATERQTLGIRTCAQRAHNGFCTSTGGRTAQTNRTPLVHTLRTVR